MITSESLESIGFKRVNSQVWQRKDIQVYFEWKDYQISKKIEIAQSFFDKLFGRDKKYEMVFIADLTNMNEQQHFEWLKNN